MSIEDDRALLGVSSGISPSGLKERFLELAQIHHPDHGGDVEMFKKIHKAFKRLEVIALRPRRCIECDGEGKVITAMRGFYSVHTTCQMCKGAGRVVLQ